MPEHFDTRELTLIFRGLSALENETNSEAFTSMIMGRPSTEEDLLNRETRLKEIAKLKGKVLEMEESLIAETAI
ncbi:MAG: hypothetical protein KDJ65_01545 [Anaerolineae bacterium]|nr:hypothetical protein [Anaerolineae bacterium]